MIVVGLIVLLATMPLSLGWREIVIASLLVLTVVVFGVWRLAAGTWKADRGPRPGWRARLASLRESVLEFVASHPARLWRVFLLDLRVSVGCGAGGVPDAAVAPRRRLRRVAEAVMFSALDRAVIIAFKFVPVPARDRRVVVGGMAGFLGWLPAIGVTLALVKKVRSIFWIGVGLLLIAAHPSRGGPEMDPPGNGSARRI